MSDLDLRSFRRELHRRPELSDAERGTSRTILRRLERSGPDRVWTELGGHGVAVAFHGLRPGPTVLLRAELDALPIREQEGPHHRSEVDGVAHLCGHDGHMTIVVAAGERLAAKRPTRGRVVLLFQPAEETGRGARRVVNDPRWGELRPEWAFAMHNLPGRPLGDVGLRVGTFNCASRGIDVSYFGSTTHAAHPEDGRSPAAAMCRLVARFDALGDPPNPDDDVIRFATVVHASLGVPSFGTAPGSARVLATLRTSDDRAMEELAREAMTIVQEEAARDGLHVELSWQDVFDASVNDAQAVEHLRAAAEELGMPVRQHSVPFRWSEDFGVLADGGRAAMFSLGAGESHPQLHAADYDFPDELIERGARMMEGATRGILDR